MGTAATTLDGPWHRVADRAWAALTSEGNNVLIRLPEHLSDETFVDAWRTASRAEPDRVDILDVAMCDDPATGLVHRLTGAKPNDDASIEDCARALLAADSQSAMVTGIRHRPDDMQRRAAELVVGWNEQCRHQSGDASRSALRLVVPTGAAADDVLSAPGLTVIQGWQASVVSPDDPWAAVVADRGQEAVRLWQLAVLPELAPFDPSLPRSARWADVSDTDVLVRILRDVAADRKWHQAPGAVQSLLSSFPGPGTHSALPADAYLPRSCRPLWEEGMIGFVYERGWELHAAVMACHRPVADVHYRVWRGLSRILWPALLFVRSQLQQRVIQSLGRAAFEQALRAARARRRGEVIEGGADEAAEFHDLADIIRSGVSDPTLSSMWRTCQAVHVGIRNPLAHGKTVRCSTLQHLVELADQLE